MLLSRFATKLFLFNFLLFICAAFLPLVQTAHAQNVCANPNLTEEVEIAVEKNNQDRTATIEVILNSPPFTNDNVNTLSVYPEDDQSASTFDDTLEATIDAEYDQSTTEFTVTVEVDIDCSGNQGVLKRQDFTFDDESENADTRYEYSVDGDNNVSASVLSPVGSQYSYEWYVDKDVSANPDFTGPEVDFAPEDIGVTDIEAQMKLAAKDQSDSLVGQKTLEISLADGNSESDSDGDGTPDSEEEGESDDDNGDGEGDGSDDDGGDGETKGLVNCGNPGADGELQESEMCDYNSFIGLIIILRDWFIGILTIAATLLFVYAGILYLTAAGDESQVGTAKEIFNNVAGGLAIVLLAFTIIATLVNLLTSQDWRDTWDPAIPIELSLETDVASELS